MSDIKSKKISWESIRQITKEIREKFMPDPNVIPVPIENIIEFKLKFDIKPIIGLKYQTDIEGLLLSDLRTIIVDNATYIEDRFNKRLRFTLAHELGHYYLHKEIIKSMKFSSYEEWEKCRLSLDENDLDWIEKQANEFAGSLLVPNSKLIELVETEKDKISKLIENSNSEDTREHIITAISRLLSDKFMVSVKVLERRIHKEQVLEGLGFFNKSLLTKW